MKKFILFISIIFVSARITAQDIHFTQYYLTPVYFNPGYSGALKDLDISMQYKGQWNLIENGFRTFGASISKRIGYKRGDRNFWASGMNAFNDLATSNLASLRINIPISYTVSFDNNNTLTNGLYVGFGQNKIKDLNFSWGNQYDGLGYDSNLPTYEPNYGMSFSFIDFGYGASWNYNHESRNVADISGFKNTLGLSVSHLSRPKYYFNADESERLDMKFIVFESAHISMKNSKISFLPSFLLQMQGGHREFLLSGLCRYELTPESRYTGYFEGSAISAGISLRAKDAISFQTMLELGNYVLGLSYDLNISDLNYSTNYRGGMEICLKFVNPSPFRKITKASF